MNDAVLPGWTTSKIGDLCDLINGKAFKPSDWSEEGLPIIRIQNLNNPNAKFNHFNGELKEKFIVSNGDLLFAWSGTPGTSFGSHIWKGSKAALNQHIFKILFDEGVIHKKFFRYAINQKLDELIRNAQGGVGLRHVTKKKFEKTEISYPPLTEQILIADKLDCLLAKVDACKARLVKVPEIIKRFRQSVLAEATSGRLTKDWREENRIRFPWKSVQLSNVADSILGKMLDKAKNRGNPTKYLRNINVRWFGFDLSDLYEMAITEEEKPKYQINDGDVLICEGGEPGRAAIWNLGDNDFIFQKAIHRVRLNLEVNPNWFLFNLKNDFNNGSLAKLYTGTTIKHLTGRSLKTYQFALPNLEEQRVIVRRVEVMFSIADQMEEKLKRTRTGVEKLTASILAKAFRGKLVPQD